MSQIFPLVNYLETFPAEAQPRPQQIEACERIAKIFTKGKKFVIACLPTGSGKSHIAAAIARSTTPIDEHRKGLIDSYGIYKLDSNGEFVHAKDFLERDPYGSYILTITKSLQEQYKNLFPESNLVKGKNNYSCAINANLTVEFAPCLLSGKLKQQCFDLDRCYFYKARNEALKSIDPILNYRAFLGLPEFLRKREVFICDEASDIESELVSQYSITIYYSQLLAENIDFKKIISDNSNDAKIWIQNVYVKLKTEVDKVKKEMSQLAKQESYTALKQKHMQRISKLTNFVSSLRDVISRWDECEYLVEHKDSEKVVLVPYDIRPLAREIFNWGDRVLLMSATITNPKEYAKSLGITEDEYEYIEIPSAFDAEKSPIACSTKYNLSYNNMATALPKVIDMAISICEQHKGQKGVIHTHTNFITEAFKKKLLGKDRFLFKDHGISNEKIMDQHKDRKDDDTVLVSPSLDTGISLDDDLGRFQIIIKAPFLPLNSKRIKKLFD